MDTALARPDRVIESHNMFDPGIIVICGSLIERLQENDLFAKFLRENLPGHLVDSRARPQLAPAVARDADWQGAALLAWDLGYQRRHTYLTSHK
jgi:predicted NBD/HSP70 family sugar kinase